MKTSALVLALFLNESAAIRYRPYTDGKTPWYKTTPRQPEDDFPIDYPVIDRGIDYDTKYDLGVMNNLEKKLKQKVATSIWDPVVEPPRDYFVPDFGQDADVKSTLSHATQAEASTGNKWIGADPPDDPPRNYYVPDFGVDEDIVSSQRNLKQTEKDLKHNIVWKSTEELKAEQEIANPVNYSVPDYGIDPDIVTTQKNGRDAQANLGVVQWDPTEAYVQSQEDLRLGKQHKKKHHHKAHSRSDPISGGLGNPENFGEYDTRAWIPLQNTNEERRLQNLPVMMRGKQVVKQVPHSLTQSRSDPICSSAGCTQFKHPTPPADPPKDYFVPNFGEDQDIKNTLMNERVASKLVGRRWDFKTPESAARYENPARDVDYNFAPELDGDIRDSIASDSIAETSLGKWDLVQRSRPNRPNMVQRHTRPNHQPNLVQRQTRPNQPNLVQRQREQRQRELRNNRNWNFGPQSRPMLAQARSDPICSSAGCTQFKHPTPPADPPKDYFVPNFGEDQDVASTLQNERIASKLVGHQWKFKTEDSAVKWENPARDVDYNFAPEFDEDVRESIASDKLAETNLGKWDI